MRDRTLAERDSVLAGRDGFFREPEQPAPEAVPSAREPGQRGCGEVQAVSEAGRGFQETVHPGSEPGQRDWEAGQIAREAVQTPPGAVQNPPGHVQTTGK